MRINKKKILTAAVAFNIIVGQGDASAFVEKPVSKVNKVAKKSKSPVKKEAVGILSAAQLMQKMYMEFPSLSGNKSIMEIATGYGATINHATINNMRIN